MTVARSIGHDPYLPSTALVLMAQARYASEAMSDYVAGGQRMFGLLTAAGQRGVDSNK